LAQVSFSAPTSALHPKEIFETSKRSTMGENIATTSYLQKPKAWLDFQP
jgi:hypothetical protein